MHTYHISNVQGSEAISPVQISQRDARQSMVESDEQGRWPDMRLPYEGDCIFFFDHGEYHGAYDFWQCFDMPNSLAICCDADGLWNLLWMPFDTGWQYKIPMFT